ncbi:MAG: translation elongation factor 4 [Oligoflexia bacterium]|nr:translation elongation factor 4 [Oligoflexia bacterium]
MKAKQIRNFSIIAHIDHGKSTLADRLIELTGTLTKREMASQILDSMDIERERGITIKAQTVRMRYKAKNGQEYILNMIDTPGHVDFTYEVSRSLAACEGAILVVDASQGVEAQTLANVYLALENNLEIFPVLNKVDLPSAEPERVEGEIEEVIGLDAKNSVRISAKTGLNVEDVLEAIVEKIPPPKSEGEFSQEAPLQALVFDSWFDSYYGVVALVRVFSGSVKKGDQLIMMHTGKLFSCQKVCYFSPRMTDADSLDIGEVGAIITGLKDVRDVKVGDTIALTNHKPTTSLKGFKEVKPMVFCGVYPIESDDYANLRDALEKLQLNDSAFTFEPETSGALGFGFRCGYLGLLHMEVVQERLERQYNLNIISTAPSVVYQVTNTDGELILVDNPSKLPPQVNIAKIEEPFIKCTVHTPNEYVGVVLALFQERRGAQVGIDYVTKDRVQVRYEMPLSEMVFDFFDKLKSVTRGYASMDYELIDYREGDLVKLDILLNGDGVDALSVIIHRSKAAHRGRELAKKLKELIERQMYEVAIQAAIGAKIVARETLSALRKNVLAKCYGGDISRKRKLLEKQKEGKKRMKQIGSVEVPQEAFMAVLKVD